MRHGTGNPGQPGESQGVLRTDNSLGFQFKYFPASGIGRSGVQGLLGLLIKPFLYNNRNNSKASVSRSVPVHASVMNGLTEK